MSQYSIQYRKLIQQLSIANANLEREIEAVKPIEQANLALKKKMVGISRDLEKEKVKVAENIVDLDKEIKKTKEIELLV